MEFTISGTEYYVEFSGYGSDLIIDVLEPEIDTNHPDYHELYLAVEQEVTEAAFSHADALRKEMRCP